MTKEEEILQEIDKLHKKLDHLHARQYMRHGWLKHLLHDLEYNPYTQYRVHITASYFWIVNIFVVLLVQQLFSDAWSQIAVLYVAIVSLYANFATDYGAASASLAAMGSNPLPEVPGETKL